MYVENRDERSRGREVCNIREGVIPGMEENARSNTAVLRYICSIECHLNTGQN